MKNLKKHFYLLLVIIMSISCQTKSEKRIEIATIDYIHFIDSVTEYKKEEGQWHLTTYTHTWKGSTAHILVN